MRIAVVVAVPHLPGEEGRWAELTHRDVPLRHASHLAALGHEVHVFFDGPPRVVGEAGFTVHVEAGPLPALGAVLWSPHLVHAARAVRPDVLHLHHLLAVENVAAAVRGLVCPVFAEFHGGTPPRRWARRRLLAWASRRLAGVFTAAPEHLAPLDAAGALARSAPRHVSPEISSRFAGPVARPPRRGGPRILVVGRCEAPKDPFATLAVLRHAVALRPDVEVVWATPGGADTAAVQAVLRDDPALAGRVRFGPVAPAAMAEVYASADVTLVTSEREIGGTVLLESLGQGTPVAAFALPVFASLGGRCEAVVQVDGRDPEALARAAVALAEQDELRSVAQAYFDAELSYAAVARARAALYRAALERG